NVRAADALGRAAAPGAIRGVVRADRRTKRLVGRLQPGEIALIDHEDLDRLAAESLIERKVRAVLNVGASASGRYPNLGPLVLAGAPVLAAARGYATKKALPALRGGSPPVFRPVLIGVDGGADALLAVGLRPDVIIGDMASATTGALPCGAELILHAYADGRA